MKWALFGFDRRRILAAFDGATGTLKSGRFPPSADAEWSPLMREISTLSQGDLGLDGEWRSVYLTSNVSLRDAADSVQLHAASRERGQHVDCSRTCHG